ATVDAREPDAVDAPSPVDALDALNAAAAVDIPDAPVAADVRDATETDRAPITGCALPSSVGAIDVRTHGARGDGTTDDTAALQSAVDAASAGSTVYVPDGTYRVHTASATCAVGGIVLRSDMTLLLAPGATLSAIPNGCGG